jgi:hypothetical protein
MADQNAPVQVAAAAAPVVRIGYVYRICCLDPLITESYVGSTDRVARMKQQHENTCKDANDKHHHYRVYQYVRENGGFDNFQMIVLERVAYTLKHELALRERHHLETKASLNMRTPARGKQEYLDANRGNKAVYDKEYREKNKHVVLANKKQYYHEHKNDPVEKAERAAYHKQHNTAKKDLRPCGCGSTINFGSTSNINSHNKTKRHTTWMAAPVVV